MEDLTGRELGPYRLISPFGEGGMATIYKAFQPGTERYVALKILPQHYAKEATFHERFQQEAQIIAKFQHPHILPVFDYGEEDNYAYLAMPLIKGGTLAKLINGGTVELSQVRTIISQVGDALDYAHSYGVVHRDVKPTNILIDERQNALLTDFGISKIVGEMVHITRTGQVIGTPAYMSPEQIKGDLIDGRSDIYSLGIVLYEMVTGRTPFRADTPPALFVKHLLDPLPPPSTLIPDLPLPVEMVILKSLAKEPNDRYQTAAQMVQAVQSAIDVGPRETSVGVPARVPDPALQQNQVIEKTTVEFEEYAAVPQKQNALKTFIKDKRTILGIAIILIAIIVTFFIAKVVTLPNLDLTIANSLSGPALNTNGLIGYWSFDEGSGSLAADSAPTEHNNDGTLFGDPAWLEGKVGSALYFDPAAEQNVQALNNAESLSIRSGPLTLSAWIKPAVVDGEFAIVAKDKVNSSSRGNYFLGINNGHLQFGFQPLPTGMDVWIDTADPLIEPHQWVHTAVTFTYGTDENPVIYVNGSAVPLGEWQGSGDQANLPFTHTDPLYIAKSDANGIYFGGIIDEVKIFDRILTPEEISAETDSG